MRRLGILRSLGSASLELALACGAFGLLFGRGAFPLVSLLVGAVIAGWWAFTSEP